MADPLAGLAGVFEREGVDPLPPGEVFRREWRARARADQVPPDGEWRVWYLRGGRGSGKTWSGAHTLAEWILTDPVPGEWGIVAPTYQDAWSTCVEGPSGFLAALGTSVEEVKNGASKLVQHWHRGYAELRMRSGHVIRVASAQDGGLRIQGKNLRGAWADEVGLWDQWQTTWDESLHYAVREGRAQIVATGTPKMSRGARKLVRRLLEDPNVPVSRLRTVDNAANLAKAFLQDTVAKAAGTRLERQELEGELLADVDGALWSAEMIDQHRIAVEDCPDLTRLVVAMDPAVTGKAGSDEHGIIAVGCVDGHAYVVADCSMRGTPDAAMRKAVNAYRKHEADRVVGEVNNGGDFIESLLRTVDADIPYKSVRASRGKAVRAEPISALYEQGRVHHVGTFPELEDQMVTWTPGDEDSPDRLDALVWGVTELGQLGGTTWSDVYGVVFCVNPACGRGFLAKDRDACPFCGTPVESDDDDTSTREPAPGLAAVPAD